MTAGLVRPHRTELGHLVQFGKARSHRSGALSVNGITNPLHQSGTGPNWIDGRELTRIRTTPIQSNMTVQQTTDGIPDGLGFIIPFNQHGKQTSDAH